MVGDFQELDDPRKLLVQVGDHRLLFVMAVDLEYGPHLADRFTPLLTGVGPVEAAVVMGDALARLDMGDALPDLVVSVGSAGSRTLSQGSVAQVSTICYRDMDATALDEAPGVTPFLGLPATLELGPHVPGLAWGTMSTGADVISGARWADIATDLVDMETWAVVRSCMRVGVDVVGLRGVSDGVSELRGVTDWTDLLSVLDERLAGAVDVVLEQVAGGLLDA